MNTGDWVEAGVCVYPASFMCCGVRIDAYGFDGAVECVLKAARSRKALSVHLCNAYTLSLARHDPAFEKILNCGDANLPDGMPLVWIARRLGLDLHRRVYGPDFMEAVIDRGRPWGIRHFFYGSTKSVLDGLVERVCARFPGLVVAGVAAPPFRPLTAPEEEGVVRELEAADADIVWVGLGTPKQDEFVEKFRDRIQRPLVAVGAAFDFHAGSVSQAPRVLQDLGLEWAYRLVQEPRRLWRRYLFGNLGFLRGVIEKGVLLEAPVNPPAADFDGRKRPELTVLMTCHNRREKTLACLRSLFAQDDPTWRLRVVVVDAGSTDNTANAIRAQFPTVEIHPGGSQLYWTAGMRIADEIASRQPADFLLWLNDDVILDPDALNELFQTYREVSHPSGSVIVVGATRDPTTGEVTYSGVRRLGFHRTRFLLVPPGTRARKAETMNGNIVLVPAKTRLRLGNLDSAFQHGMADYDYGLRARALGIPVWVAPNMVGTCSRNSTVSRRRTAGTVSQRFRALRSPKGLPCLDWATFTSRHAGRLWPLYWASPYVRAALRWRS